MKPRAIGGNQGRGDPAPRIRTSRRFDAAVAVHVFCATPDLRLNFKTPGAWGIWHAVDVVAGRVRRLQAIAEARRWRPW